MTPNLNADVALSLSLTFVPFPSLVSGLSSVALSLNVFICAFLLVLAYACVSSYVYAALMMMVRALVPAGPVRSGVHWFLALLYLGALVVLLPNWVLPLLTAYTAGNAFHNPSTRYILLSMPAVALFNFAQVFIGYVVAATLAPAIRPNNVPPPPLVTTPGELAWRVFLIMINSSVNLLLATLTVDIVLYPRLGAAAHVLAVLLACLPCLLNLLAIIVPVLPAALRLFIHGLLGWLNWFMPASWLVIALGWVLFLLNLLGNVLFALPFFPSGPFFAILRVEIHWPTGTIFTEGGVAANLWLTSGQQGAGLPQGPPPWILARGAYDMGDFSFVHSGTAIPIPGIVVTLAPGSQIDQSLLDHESGHNLSLAAFGSFFHAIGACDENLTGNPPTLAYAERLAESHDLINPSNDPIVPMWN